jgi:hypothetical protein
MTAMTEPYEGMWDYDGACKPQGDGSTRYLSQATFSVGCFQWVQKSSSKGLKRGKVAKRFSGPTSDPQQVYAAAARWCTDKNTEAAP